MKHLLLEGPVHPSNIGKQSLFTLGTRAAESLGPSESLGVPIHIWGLFILVQVFLYGLKPLPACLVLSICCHLTLFSLPDNRLVHFVMDLSLEGLLSVLTSSYPSRALAIGFDMLVFE